MAEKFGRNLVDKVWNAGSRVAREEVMKENDSEYAERKAQIFETLKTLIDQKRTADPTFNLTTNQLDALVKENRDLFFGITGANGVLRYWSNELNYLKERLGLPVKNRRRLL